MVSKSKEMMYVDAIKKVYYKINPLAKVNRNNNLETSHSIELEIKRVFGAQILTILKNAAFRELERQINVV